MPMLNIRTQTWCPLSVSCCNQVADGQVILLSGVFRGEVHFQDHFGYWKKSVLCYCVFVMFKGLSPRTSEELEALS